MVLRLSLLLLAAVALTATASSQVIDVPGDYPTPQEAIDNAPPGAVIRVSGIWGSIVVDRPLTLIGPAIFEGQWTGSCCIDAPIQLAGPGQGTVVVSDISTGMEWVQGSYLLSLPAGIEGGGFDELHVIDSVIRPPTCNFYGRWECYLHGEILGRPGIEVGITGDVPTVVIERSVVLGGSNGNDQNGGSPYDGPPGVRAPASTVIALGSLIAGGASDDLYYPWPCAPDSCTGYGAGYDGAGGPAVLAAALYHSDTELRGGLGAGWYGTNGTPYYEFCGCTGPDGAPSITVSPPVALKPTLSLRPPRETRPDLELQYGGPNGAQLFFSWGLRPPPPAAGGLSGSPLGLPFLLETPIRWLGPLASGVTILPIPQQAALIGREVAFQAYHARAGFSRPAAGVLR
jgi:hypothetical protein